MQMTSQDFIHCKSTKPSYIRLYLFHEFLCMYITHVLHSVSVVRFFSHSRRVRSNPSRVYMYIIVIQRFLVIYSGIYHQAVVFSRYTYELLGAWPTQQMRCTIARKCSSSHKLVLSITQLLSCPPIDCIFNACTKLVFNWESLNTASALKWFPSRWYYATRLA